MFKTYRLVLMVAVLSFASFIAEAAEPLDQIVAIVNDNVVTQSQLDAALEQAHQQMAQRQMQAPSEAELRSTVLNQLIDQDLLLQIAQKSKIQITPEELNKALAGIAEENHLSLAQFQEKVQLQTGASFADFKKQLKTQMTLGRLQQMAIGSTITITDAQVNKALREAQQVQQASTEYHLIDVLIPLSENPSATELNEAKLRAQAIIPKLKAGQSIEEPQTTPEAPPENLWSKTLNYFKSETPPATLNLEENTAPQIQDLGWRQKTDLPTAFQAATQLPIGEIVGPIQTPNGLHLLKVEGIHQPPQAALTAEQMRMQLYQAEIMKQFPAWLKKMRDAAYIKITPSS